MTGITGILILAASVAGQAPAAVGLDITLYRSFTPPNVTVVNGLFRVDGAMLGSGTMCEYHVRLAVIDSTGTRLVNNEWDGRCPPPRDGRPSASLETFQFAVVPARYTVEITVDPKGHPDKRISAKAGLESLSAEALVSDLILARKTGWTDQDSSVQWTIRKGKLGIAAASEAVAMESSPSLAYYLEVYPSAADPMTGELSAIIRRTDGLQIAKMPLQKLQGVAEARPVAGNMSLEGLAPGDYVLETRLDLGDTVLIRTHEFRMEGAQLAGGDARTGGIPEYWASIDPAELSRLFDPVQVILQKQQDRDLYDRLNTDGRRRFLAQYFGVSGPSAGGAAGNPLDLYLDRIEYVNRTYSTRSGESGWRTDRGRVYLLRGEPQSRAERMLTGMGGAPYEIWQYTVAPGYAYLFTDETRIGSYQLLWTNDPSESSVADWEERISPEAAEDMLRLGIRPRTSRTGIGSQN